MDAISNITSRISYIESQLAAIRGGPAPTGAVAAPASGAGFAEAYAGALASVGAGSVGLGASSVGTLTAGAGSVGRTQLNPKGVPLDLVAYGNGRIPGDALAQVGNTRHRLWAPAAHSLDALMADAKRAGVTIGITDSYRPFAEQVDLAKRKGLYSQGGLAAKPGTSDHGWGMAVDLDLNSKAQAWMRANGARYGFKEDTPREPWHWAYMPRA